MFGTGGLLDFVLATVLIRGHVTYVSDIHHVSDSEAIEAERTFERVYEHVGPQVAEMLRQIDGRSARIIRDLRRVTGLKLLDPSAQRIKDVKRPHERMVA